jgi:hypothetical protein
VGISFDSESRERSTCRARARIACSRSLADLWKRPDLNRRNRSIATLAALIACNQTIQIPLYLTRPSMVASRHCGDHHGSCVVFRAVERDGGGMPLLSAASARPGSRRFSLSVSF